MITVYRLRDDEKDTDYTTKEEALAAQRIQGGIVVRLTRAETPIECCARLTGHALVAGTGFCKCTHVMYDTDKSR